MKTPTRIAGGILLGVTATLLLQQPAAEAEFNGPVPLGPASEVVLEAEAKTVTLKLEDGHVAFGDSPSHRIYSEGWVSIGPLLEGIMDNETFIQEREELSTSLQADEAKLNAAFAALQAEAEGLEPDDERLVALGEQHRDLMQQRQAFMQMAQQAMNGLNGTHLEKAYRELVDAVKIVAESKSIDIVHRFIPTDEPFTGKSAQEALMEVRMRNLLVYPDGLDLTADVADELGVELSRD